MIHLQHRENEVRGRHPKDLLAVAKPNSSLSENVFFLAMLHIRHPGQSLPLITQQQLSQSFIPLLPNTAPSHPNFVAIQRVLSLPFQITISMSHANNTRKGASSWKPSFFSRSVDEPLTDFEKLSQEQIEQLALDKSSIFLTLFFYRRFSWKSLRFHLSNGLLLFKAEESRSRRTQQSSSRHLLFLRKHCPIQRRRIDAHNTEGRTHHRHSWKVLLPARIPVGWRLPSVGPSAVERNALLEDSEELV